MTLNIALTFRPTMAAESQWEWRLSDYRGASGFAPTHQEAIRTALLAERDIRDRDLDQRLEEVAERKADIAALDNALGLKPDTTTE